MASAYLPRRRCSRAQFRSLLPAAAAAASAAASRVSQALLVGFVFLGVYLSAPTANYSYDSIGYVGAIHRATYLQFGTGGWHPYHMLYIPTGYVVGKSLVALGGTPDILVMMQVVNAIFSALALMLFYHAVVKESGQIASSLVATGALGSTYAWWYYSTDPEPYPLAILTGASPPR